MTTPTFEQNKETATLRQQQGNYPDKTPYFLFDFFETIGIEDQTVLVETRDVSGDGAWGKGFANTTHTANNLTWGQTGAIWQSTYTNATAISSVINPSGTFAEHFVDNTFVDTTTSTATLSLGASGTISFTNGQILQSKTIHKDGTVITKATLYINTSLVTGTLTYALSANGGSNWETVTPNTVHTFTNTGTELKYKIISTGSSSISTDYDTNNKILEVKIN